MNTNFQERPCSVARSLDILSDRWTFLVLREAFFGVRRFGEIQRNLGIARNTLTNRLKTLVEKGIFERHRYQDRPDRYEYRFSKKGLDLYPIPLTLMQWGDRWLAGEAGPPLILFHKPCGHNLKPVISCVHCGIEVKPRDVHYEPGPGMVNPIPNQGPPKRLRWRGPSESDKRPCSVSRALSILFDRWTFLVIREAFFGVRRFDEIQNNLNIARNTLTNRLKMLVDHGILERNRYHEHPERFEYCLAEKGLDLYPLTLALMRFGDRWLAGKSGPPLLLYHTPCGHRIEPILTCADCGGEIMALDVRYRYSQGFLPLMQRAQSQNR